MVKCMIDGKAVETDNANPPVVPVAAPPVSQLAPLAFLARFTAAEQRTIAAAALANPAILLWLMQAMGARYVDLLDPLTAAGVTVLTQAGLLTSARASQILTP